MIPENKKEINILGNIFKSLYISLDMMETPRFPKNKKNKPVRIEG
jgi:hypothetical protein